MKKEDNLTKKRKKINGAFRVLLFLGMILLLFGAYGFKETYISSNSSGWSGSKSSKTQSKDETATFVFLGGGIGLIIISFLYRNSALNRVLLEEQVSLMKSDKEEN